MDSSQTALNYDQIKESEFNTKVLNSNCNFSEKDVQKVFNNENSNNYTNIHSDIDFIKRKIIYLENKLSKVYYLNFRLYTYSISI